jgi:hypothetical protein
MGLLTRLWALIFLSAAMLPAATSADVVARLLALRNATDFTAAGRLVHVAASGERTSTAITFRAHTFPDGLRIFCDVSATPRARLLMFIPSKGPASIHIGHPGDPAPKQLSSEHWSDTLLGTFFTYEDLLENSVLWRRQTLLPEARFGARQCLVLRSEPGPADHSQYAAVTTWLDRDIYSAVKVEKVVKGSGQVKTFIYYGLREVKGVWSASQIECKIEGQSGSSLLIVNRGAEKPHLDRAAFDPALLTKP